MNRNLRWFCIAASGLTVGLAASAGDYVTAVVVGAIGANLLTFADYKAGKFSR